MTAACVLSVGGSPQGLTSNPCLHRCPSAARCRGRRGQRSQRSRGLGPPAPPASFSRVTPRGPGGRGRCEPKPQKKGVPRSHAAALNRATAPPGNVGQYLRHCGLSRGGSGAGGVWTLGSVGGDQRRAHSAQQGRQERPGLQGSDPRVSALPCPRFRLLSLRLRPVPAHVCRDTARIHVTWQACVDLSSSQPHQPAVCPRASSLTSLSPSRLEIGNHQSTPSHGCWGTWLVWKGPVQREGVQHVVVIITTAFLRIKLVRISVLPAGF